MIATPLKNRILLGNGVNVVEPDEIVNLLIKGVPISKIQSTELNEELKQFNLRADEEIQIFSEEQEMHFDYEWLIPKEYSELDLYHFFLSKLESVPENLLEQAEIRILTELEEVENRQFQFALKTVIYVVDILKHQNVVWGVGRGSSCASYLLFLLGLHCVDCLKYNISHTEFFHD